MFKGGSFFSPQDTEDTEGNGFLFVGRPRRNRSCIPQGRRRQTKNIQSVSWAYQKALFVLRTLGHSPEFFYESSSPDS